MDKELIPIIDDEQTEHYYWIHCPWLKCTYTVKKGEDICYQALYHYCPKRCKYGQRT